MALRSVVSSKIPMVIIMGATGTGKTKLSLELAQKFQTEIISADSMQVYKGLDVVTAKATAAERELVRHHLLDILEPQQRFTVVDFRNRALKIMQELTEKGKIPVIAGGTNYYLEAIVYNILVEEEGETEELLWDRSIRNRELDEPCTSTDEPECKKAAKTIEDAENNDQAPTDPNSKEKDDKSNAVPSIDITDEFDQEKVKYEMDNEKLLTNEQIHLRLMTIDPVMAEKLHPNNRRKMLRSIEVWQKTGRRHSEVLEQQKQTEGRLRRPGATVMLWLKCEQSVHEARLDARVDEMLEQGLVREMMDFHDKYNRQRLKDGTDPDYTKGVFQTLGFKEFHQYLMMGEEQRETEEGKLLLQRCIEDMKIGTKRFARRQNKMVRQRFLEHRNRDVPPIYELDTSNLASWDTEVKEKAIHIVESYLNESPCTYSPIKPRLKEEEKMYDVHAKHYCEVCRKIILGDKEIAIHLSSNKHKKVLQKRKLEENTKTLTLGIKRV